MKKLFRYFVVVIVVAVAVFVITRLPKNNNSAGTKNSQTSENNYVVSTEGDGSLNIYFLNVGQGDCSIIVFPDNKTMIIDSGNNYSSNEKKISEFTNKLNIDTFDYLLLTHADADHVGCMDYVLENYIVKHVFRPNVLSTYKDAKNLKEGINVGFTDKEGGKTSGSLTYYQFLFALQNEEDCVDEIFNKDSDFSGAYSDGEKVFEYKFDFLTPTAYPTAVKFTNANDYSPICTLTYNGVTVLFTGDAEAAMENQFLSYYSTYPDCDVLKVGHHGSESSSSQAFLNAVKPEFAVIQCAVENSYKHPRQLILDRLRAMNTTVFRNDNNGDITFAVTCSEGYAVTADKFLCAVPDLSKNYIGGDAV